jgi:hypothetical protein
MKALVAIMLSLLTSAASAAQIMTSADTAGCPPGCGSCSWGSWEDPTFPDTDEWNLNYNDQISCYLRQVINNARPAVGLLYNVVTLHGVDNTGNSNATPGIMAALAAPASSGKFIYFPTGHYRLDTQISVGSDQKLFAEHEAHFYLNYTNGSNGNGNGMVKSATFNESCASSPPCWEEGDTDNVTIIGGTWHGQPSNSPRSDLHAGHIFNWDGDNWHIDGVFVERYHNARAIIWYGGGNLVENSVVRRPNLAIGNAGVMTRGTNQGSTTTMRYLDVETGDDCLAVTPSARGTGYSERHINNVISEYVRCKSHSGRVFIAGLHNAGGQPTLRSDVLNTTFRNISGIAQMGSNNKNGAILFNTFCGDPGVGTVSGVEVRNVKITVPNIDQARFGLKIECVDDPSLDNVTINGGVTAALLVDASVTDCSVSNSYLSAFTGVDADVNLPANKCSEITWTNTTFAHNSCTGPCCP